MYLENAYPDILRHLLDQLCLLPVETLNFLFEFLDVDRILFVLLLYLFDVLIRLHLQHRDKLVKLFNILSDWFYGFF